MQLLEKLLNEFPLMAKAEEKKIVEEA